MKIPKSPPDFNDILEKILPNVERVVKIFAIRSDEANRGSYPHWDKLLHLPPPDDLTYEEWWLALKWGRKTSFKPIPLKDKEGRNFKYSETDIIAEHLHEIDFGAGGKVQIPEEITNKDLKDRYIVSSLIEEAITSSQLEGAVTTVKVAKEMIRSGRKPINKSEQMILNNYRTMTSISGFKDQPLTTDLVYKIHRLVTEETLEDPSAAGRLRKPNEEIYVWDHTTGDVFHHPPPAGELQDRMSAMCDFANGKTPKKSFVHPAIRSIILHFWLAYDHPFVDGNGRTARALFYWSMLKYGYWLFEFISISQILLKAPSKYARAFLYTETDDNDLTYFIIHQLEVIHRSINHLHSYIQEKAHRREELESQLSGVTVLNHRQRALISHALRHPSHRYTVRSHRTCHRVVNETASRDLYNLVNRKLLKSKKVGRTYYFTPVEALEEKLASLK